MAAADTGATGGAAGTPTTTFNVTYSHYTDIDKGTIGTGDLFVSGPNGFNAPASLESVSGSGLPTVLTATQCHRTSHQCARCFG